MASTRNEAFALVQSVLFTCQNLQVRALEGVSRRVQFRRIESKGKRIDKLNGVAGAFAHGHFDGHLPEFRKGDQMPGREDTVPRKLIPATELAEFVYCAKAWELKYVQGAESSAEAQQLQVEGNAWHAAQRRQLARSDSFRWAAFIALALAIILFFFVWMGWAR